MKKGATDRLSAITETERALRHTLSARLNNLLDYFEYLEETVLIALENSNKPFHISSDKNNPLLLAVVATSRSVSIAKAAMDMALSGHPLEAIALTRVLAEIAQCTQYLVRHPDSIDRFISGSLKLDRILKAAKAELPAGSRGSFGRFRGIASEYSHASPDLLSIALSIEGPLLKAPVIVTDVDRAEDAAHGIAVTLLGQYFTFRLTLRGAIDPLAQLAERDTMLFDPENAHAILTEGVIDDAQLREMMTALTTNVGPA